MTQIRERGQFCGGTALELTGEFTGYHNGPTMQVGLWVSNDARYVRPARDAVLARRGALGLAVYLRAVLRGAWPGSAPYAVMDVVSRRDLDSGEWF